MSYWSPLTLPYLFIFKAADLKRFQAESEQQRSKINDLKRLQPENEQQRSEMDDLKTKKVCFSFWAYIERK